jgi:hypothetical protein
MKVSRLTPASRVHSTRLAFLFWFRATAPQARLLVPVLWSGLPLIFALDSSAMVF